MLFLCINFSGIFALLPTSLAKFDPVLQACLLYYFYRSGTFFNFFSNLLLNLNGSCFLWNPESDSLIPGLFVKLT